jgi:cytochrome c-type biogenesis protein CcmH
VQQQLTAKRVRVAGALALALIAVLATTAGLPDGKRADSSEPESPVLSGAGDSTAASIEEATLALETRLALGGGTQGEWDLLAQSYEFLGRSEEAQRARDRRVTAERTLRDSIRLSESLLRSTRRPNGLQPSTKDAAVLLARADDLRHRREFRAACAAYQAVVDLGAMTADSWADYGDAQGSLDGDLGGRAAAFIDRALALDPSHAKALWLKASLAHEQRRYSDALEIWRQLLAVLPSESSDALIVEANINEAMRLRPTGASG